MTTRRDLLLSFGAALACAPLRALAQDLEKPRRIGVLAPLTRQEAQERIVPLDRALRDLGRVDGRNLRIEWRFADGQYDRLPGLANELVALGVEVIVCLGGTPAALAAQKATKTIPVVFVNVADPVRVGLVDSLARPGRNATGLANLTDVIAVKHLEMLRGLVPGLSHVAAIENGANPNVTWVREGIRAACTAARTKLSFYYAQTPEEIDEAFSRIRAERPGALLVSSDSFIHQQRKQVADRAAAIRLPSIGHHVGYAESGGLASYGSNPDESFRLAAGYIDKILKGARPQDLPVEQPTRLHLVINGRTAKALGLSIPPELLLMADRVIE